MTTEPVEKPPVDFSGWRLFFALLVSLFFGGIANIISGLVAGDSHNRVLAFFIGAIPGALFMLASLAASRNGWRQGFMIGGCIILLIGGACGVSMVGMSFH